MHVAYNMYHKEASRTKSNPKLNTNRNKLHFGFIGEQNKFDSSKATGQLIDTDEVSWGSRLCIAPKFIAIIL